MTYQQLIDQEFCRLVPTFDLLQQQLLVLAQSVPQEKLDFSLSVGKDSIFVFVYAKHLGSIRQQATIEFYRWHSPTQWIEALGIIRNKCMNPPAKPEPSHMEILVEQLRSERLEVIRLRNIVKFMEQAL